MSEQIASMELKTLPGQVPSAALAWALLLDSATVSFDAHDDWSRAWVEAISLELADDGNIIETQNRLRNASQSSHVDEHAQWLQLLGVSEGITAAQVWRERSQRFPGLVGHELTRETMEQRVEPAFALRIASPQYSTSPSRRCGRPYPPRWRQQASARPQAAAR